MKNYFLVRFGSNRHGEIPNRTKPKNKRFQTKPTQKIIHFWQFNLKQFGRFRVSALLKSDYNHINFKVALARLLYSDSVKDLEITCCFFEEQEMTFLSR